MKRNKGIVYVTTLFFVLLVAEFGRNFPFFCHTTMIFLLITDKNLYMGRSNGVSVSSDGDVEK